jgi:glycosyltransferase involved in cell wall biosynthesis
MSKITFCIPSKDNLRYLKGAITSIRQYSTTNPDILVYVDSSNDGTVEWLVRNNVPFLQNSTGVPQGIAYGYNRCIEAATTDVVCMFHADMYMAPGFDSSILSRMEPTKVVAGTRIEPPLHPPGIEKIIQDFGMYPEDFRENDFLSYTKTLVTQNYGKTTKGIFAPWAVLKQDVIALGLHDENLHSYHEDSDIFNRFVLAGFTIEQSWEAYVYHLTCRGGQFQDGIHTITNDQRFHKMKSKSFKEFIRKWGQFIRNDEFHYPMIQPRYKKSAIILNPTLDLLRVLEPWFDSIHVDNTTLAQLYVKQEQPLTTRNLQDTFTTVPMDISVTVDGLHFTKEDYDTIQNFGYMLSQLDQAETGTYEVGNLLITIKKLQPIDVGYIPQDSIV